MGEAIQILSSSQKEKKSHCECKFKGLEGMHIYSLFLQCNCYNRLGEGL